ncbi:uncharacterized protein [Heliangelus exortis]|uniref:uncharacterized protein n=1 Tax=Heliangelus exortis TaxID=472823 RepID=UPI003A8D05FC
MADGPRSRSRSRPRPAVPAPAARRPLVGRGHVTAERWRGALRLLRGRVTDAVGRREAGGSGRLRRAQAPPRGRSRHHLRHPLRHPPPAPPSAARGVAAAAGAGTGAGAGVPLGPPGSGSSAQASRLEANPLERCGPASARAGGKRCGEHGLCAAPQSQEAAAASEGSATELTVKRGHRGGAGGTFPSPAAAPLNGMWRDGETRRAAAWVLRPAVPTAVKVNIESRCQYKSHQHKGKVTMQIHDPKEHQPEAVLLVSFALFGTLGTLYFPNRNFVFLSCLWGRTSVPFPATGEVGNINRVLQRSGM